MTTAKPSLARTVRASAAVLERAGAFGAAMDRAGVPHAIGGDVAALAHVDRAEPSAVRNAGTVEAILNQTDFDCALSAAAAVGLGLDAGEGVRRLHLRPPPGRSPPPDAGAVRIFFAGEPVGEAAVPRVGESEVIGRLRVLTLPALTRMLLGRWKLNDRVSLRDFMEEDVRLIDDTWPARFPPPLGDRLQALLDDPDG